MLAAAVVALTVPGVAHAGSNIVIAPKSGQKLTHSPVKVSVRAGWKVRELRVWLNGESVSEEFRRADIGKRNRRTVRLSASHGCAMEGTSCACPRSGSCASAEATACDSS